VTPPIRLAIPPGDPMYQSTARATFTNDVKMISMQPHYIYVEGDFDIKPPMRTADRNAVACSPL